MRALHDIITKTCMYCQIRMNAMAMREGLASDLALSNTLKHAISAKRSFLSSVILLNTSAHNTACDVCKKKFIKASQSVTVTPG